MKTRALSILVLISSFLSCKKSDPVSPKTPPPVSMDISGYGEVLDSLYFKMWSDSSWSQYGGMKTINGTLCVTELASDGSEYYYSALGYAGFKPAGDSSIVFDAPIPGLPDTLVFGQTYTQRATFTYYGYSFVLTNEQTLKDTVSVAVTFGIFDPCLHFTSNVTITGGGQSDVQSGEFWIAQGPGSIKQIPGSGAAIVMVRGRVNGKGWGMPYATVRPNQMSSITRFEKSALFLLGRTGALLPRGNR